MLQRGILGRAHDIPHTETGSFMKAIRITYACLLVVSVSGCMQARIEESRELATPISKGERIVVLAKPQIEGAGAEEDFMDCVGHGLSGGAKHIEVTDNNEFVD